MGCSNFCTPRDLDELNYYTRDITSEQEREYQAIQKAQAMTEVGRAASTAGADPVHGSFEQQIAAGGASIVTATLAAAVLTAFISAPVQGLIEALSTTIAAHRASEM